MKSNRLVIKPGVVVVFEGIDAAGKSTQVSALKRKTAGSVPRPHYIHMPSGLKGMSREIYRITEKYEINTSVARQMLHMAAHNENANDIETALQAGSVVLDRWWWSTYAYGVASDIPIEEDIYKELCQLAWKNIHPSITFLFLYPYEYDKNNSPRLASAYRQMAENSDHEVCLIDQHYSREELHDKIVRVLLERELAHTMGRIGLVR